MSEKKQKYLITSALPYVNYNLHIGHMIGCLLPSDVYARFCRGMGRDVLFVCGADEHGTTSEVGAMKEGMPVEEYVDKYRSAHEIAVKQFNLSFDLYGRTHTKLHEKLIQDLFTRLDDQGMIEEKVSIQPFSIKDEMFLADRFVIGTCPKCGFEGAYGNECPKCNATLEPGDLINPHSSITTDSPVEMRETKHLYFKLSKMEDQLRDWLKSRTGWPKTAMAIANKWLNEGLRDTPITRDLKWGIPVNKPGFEGKVFYVWFDAPWGYVSISQAANKNWADWWKNNDCHYAQFMGKDNVAFHAVFFPAQELAMNNDWKTVDILKAFNFLNFEGAKISKSTGNGIFLNDAINDAPADAWRYALLASAPETDDSDFTIGRFAEIVNKDLNGILGNFVSRVCKINEKNFGLNVPEFGDFIDLVSFRNDIDLKLNDLKFALDACEFRKAISILRELWSYGNEFFTKTEPWALVKQDRAGEAADVLNICFQLIDLYARISAPFIPETADKMIKIFNTKLDLSWPTKFEWRINGGTEFKIPENLFTRIDEDKVKFMSEKYIKQTPKIVIAKILTANPHPDSDHLQVLSVDAGDGKPLEIVCGAPNARAGLVSVLARVGAKLPAFDMPLVARKVRGVLSNGMMCAEDELGLGNNHDGIIELPDDSIIGSEFKF